MLLHTPLAQEADFDALAELRRAAMRPSLEALGRYDPARSRERLRASFDPALTRHIEADGERVGFFILDDRQPVWRLAHFYLHPDHSGRGIGSAVLAQLRSRARALGASIELTALRGSRSNAFYLAQGFEKVGESEWDVAYRYTGGA
ncbi:GNAT family N-acetyltransferase [Bordetella avium]|uniref:GnaT-family acetyltransferase n=1 Tax=Bordetella avium (strain 197N) TaxID=360910 RepID=Q2KWQ9_BORA1|nr:GNAT family N-acetyltransferase [Bordetella avium]AZY48314.1 N-acetyltransferase [Bordetella avium]AZY51697.1 N-acetyltransferase [Bordetella avium]RIQ13441.1 GNAT family N-acetyltransferase [Bordetella avium]RIQ16603.1 GNAT family N-acetyltransferase [Bordetella avium]RIQ31363.1 GNAT family N-acetyltransferase [Bordetella avium]